MVRRQIHSDSEIHNSYNYGFLFYTTPQCHFYHCFHMILRIKGSLALLVLNQFVLLFSLKCNFNSCQFPYFHMFYCCFSSFHQSADLRWVVGEKMGKVEDKLGSRGWRRAKWGWPSRLPRHSMDGHCQLWAQLWALPSISLNLMRVFTFHIGFAFFYAL